MEKQIRHMSDADAMEFLQNEYRRVAIAVFLLPVEDGDKNGYAPIVAIDKDLDTTAMAAGVTGLLRCLDDRNDSRQVIEMVMAALDDDEEAQSWS